MTTDLTDLTDAAVPGWVADAACLDTDPHLFFPDRGGQVGEAVEVCRGCPVRQDCLDYALTNRITVGVWGGTSANRRRSMDKPDRPLQPCGTTAAYERHRRAGEQACQPCLDAKAAYTRKMDARTA